MQNDALGRPARGNARLINTPVFMDAKNLQPFINQELIQMINKMVEVGNQAMRILQAKLDEYEEDLTQENTNDTDH
ncbi:hypothetical protein AAX06_01195 [Moraxella bovoculi]|uniref:Uncharacterized protein n=1 Tax=Moraxella bovoculi TaxID=386891 RepID=A0AAC8T7D1_9GAMM|nr:hypothetical protein [Moraxella bovoculi]AKG07027.1 hypothetical protein AAX06_01195 [Moraxella bovoculi]AKG12223.1 hypothetical protein AAX07_09880 [Moraxella bovoculi]